MAFMESMTSSDDAIYLLSWSVLLPVMNDRSDWMSVFLLLLESHLDGF